MALVIPRAVGRQAGASRWQDFDLVLLVATLLLLGFGVVVIGTVSGPVTSWSNNFAVRQLIAAGAGLVALVGLTLLNYRLLASLTPPLYIFNLALLVLVERFGYTAGGSTRWFDLKIFLMQPSQFAQIFLVLCLAALLARWDTRLRRIPYLLATLVMMVLPAYLIYRQPDLGSALVFGFVWVAMIVTSKADWRHLVGLAALSLPAGWFAWTFLAHDYMRDRLTIFLHPESDATGQGFNIIQSRIAIGAGGLFGQGVEGGTQTQLQFLRVQQIDFIFAASSEQFGFIGSIALFVLYIVLLWRCLVIAGEAPDAFGQYVCIGVAAVYFFLAVVNIGMNVGLMPVTGIPLPLISYGGSSLLVLLAMQGLVQSVAIRRRRLAF